MDPEDVLLVILLGVAMLIAGAVLGYPEGRKSVRACDSLVVESTELPPATPVGDKFEFTFGPAGTYTVTCVKREAF